MKSIETTDHQDIILELLDGKKEKSKNVLKVLESQPPPLLFSKRLLAAVLLFFCYINFQVLRNNMNIAVVEMMSNKSIIRGNITIFQPPEFNWDATTVGVVISVINYGGLLAISNLFIVDKLGASTTCAISMFLAGITTMLHPAILRQSFYAFLVLRFLTGFLEAMFYASTAEIRSIWFPIKERSTLTGFSFNGTNVGVAIVYPFCGYVAHKWGWPMVFYATGAESSIISILLLILVKNHPSQDKNISKAELEYILGNNQTAALKQEKNHDETKEKILSVFKSMLKSGPLWSFYILTFTYMWIASVITACLPLYVKDLTGKESDEVGYISSIPNIVYIFMFPIAGAVLDYWKNHSSITTTKMHKIMLSVAYITCAIFFVGITFVSDLSTSIILFVLIQFSTSFVPLIISIILVSLAPNHVSHVASINVYFFTLAAIAAQTIIGFMTTNHTLQEWNNTFFLTAAIVALGNVIIVIFGSSDAQSWSLPQSGKAEGIDPIR